MISDFDDDEHFCIKCHITIHGLDNYVNHRKVNCLAAKDILVMPKSPPLPSQLLAQDETFGLKADDFFSSLELQSSSKKPPAPSTSGKIPSGILTRSKTSAVIHASTSGGQHHRDAETHQSKSGKNAWIGGHQLKELGSGDNHTRLIKAVDNLSRTAYLKKEEPPTAPPIVSSYNDNTDEESDDYDYDDEDDDDEDPRRHHTGGKWAPEWSYPEAPPVSGGKSKPPKAATLGSPSYDPRVPPPNYTRGKWKPPDPKESDHQGQYPPPGYTRGKWKPPDPKDSEHHGQYPPPGYTRGKWKPPSAEETKQSKRSIIDDTPPFRKSNGRIQYWCNPCNRVLSSKIVYERHLKSELHFKRTLHEAEFDDSATTAASSAATNTSPHLNTNHDKEAKRTIREPVEYWTHTGSSGANNKDTMKNARTPAQTAAATNTRATGAAAAAAKTCDAFATTTTSTPATTTTTMAAHVALRPTITTSAVARPAATLSSAHQPKKRFRRRIYTKCAVCLARVTTQMMGKHLISHYHCRKGDIRQPEAKQMVLDHIHAVVLQAPYQCAACKFYCNTHEYFLRHWRSDEHAATLRNNEGILTCTFCKFSTMSGDDNDAMYRHLVSQEHEEVISVINRSVPIVIRNVLPVQCGSCSEVFVFNLQLREHCRLTGHELSISATDSYQEKQLCHICNTMLHSSVALQRHLRRHDASMYFCTQCNVKCKTKEEIQQHRLSQLHKLVTQKSAKKCSYCPKKFGTFNELQSHLRDKHSGNTTKCLNCERTFLLPQELSEHIRRNVCNIRQTTESAAKYEHRCDICTFACESVSELIFHKALHTESLRLMNTKQPHYKCPLCEKYFAKSSLLYHIQNQHTSEKTYTCRLCDAKFARKNNWLAHEKKHWTRVVKLEKNFLCATCGAKFTNNTTLKKHMLIHSGKQFKCNHPGCIHMARTPADLRVHQQSTHSTEMSYRCDRCDYRGKSKQQLKRHSTIHEYAKKYQCSQCTFTCRLQFHLRRHARIHTGAKPYACPHCEYKCNNLENLRKHVLLTSKHPGKCLYECKFCEADAQFQSNLAKDFKVHLLAEHGQLFGSVTQAAGYIAGIYDSVDDVAKAVAASSASMAMTTTTALLPKTEPEEGPSSAIGHASTSAVGLHKANKINPGMLGSVAENETSGALLIQSQETTFENKGPNDEELFPMYIIAKEEEVVYVDKEAWCMVGNFGVEESGALVSFDEDSGSEQLFQGQFD